MAEKKSKVAKTTITKPKKEPEAIDIDKIHKEVYKVIDILIIPSFDYFIIAKQYGFDDNALFTIAQFKEMYKKAIEGR